MSHNEKQHSRVLQLNCRCRCMDISVAISGYNGGAEKVRSVQRKGEAVEGEPRTTRQAAEKGELSVDGGAGGKSEEE